MDDLETKPSSGVDAPSAGSANLAAFGKEILEIIQERMADGEEDYDWLEIALKHGLVEQVIYDPDKHGYIIDAEPGHTIYWWCSETAESQNVKLTDAPR